MELGLGLPGWTPDVFWKATFPELLAAIKGDADRWNSIFGGKKKTPPTKAQVLKDFERHDKAVKAGKW